MTHPPRIRHLLLTVDYEIFGNGSGDVRQHIVDPTERMARACERHGVPLTVFFEAEEYVAFEQNAARLRASLGYDPAELIRQQVADLARRGHDFQLHLHPQWHGTSLDESGKWRLCREHETVDHLFATQAETSDYIARRQRLVEDLVASSGVRRSVIAYRAGAFSARPGRKLLPALAANGFLFESSVARGLLRRSPHYTLDYRDVTNPKHLWRVADDVGLEQVRGPLWEIPVHSELKRRFRQITPHRLRAKFSRNIPRAQQMDMVDRFANPRRPLQLLKSLLEPVPIKLDFHNMTPSELMGMIRRASWKPDLGPVDVLVLIGHTKEHVDDHSFNRFLARVAADPELKVVTFADIASQLRGEASLPA
jgi:hypothetical protein